MFQDIFRFSYFHHTLLVDLVICMFLMTKNDSIRRAKNVKKNRIIENKEDYNTNRRTVSLQ
jgi:hypothetical protein